MYFYFHDFICYLTSTESVPSIHAYLLPDLHKKRKKEKLRGNRPHFLLPTFLYLQVSIAGQGTATHSVVPGGKPGAIFIHSSSQLLVSH